MKKDPNNSPKRILRMPEVQARLGISRSGIYERIKNGLIKNPINLGGRCVGFLESDINQFIEDRIEKSIKAARKKLRNGEE